MLAAAPARAAELSFVAGTIVQPEGANEGDTLAGGTVIETGADGIAMVENRWRSDIPGRQCIEIAIFGYGQSYTVSADETPGRCDTTIPTNPGSFREGEAFLTKETRYGDAAFDEPNPPEKVKVSQAQWRGFDQWMRNAERTFTGDVVSVGGGKIRVRSPMTNRTVSFAADASAAGNSVSLDSLVDERVRVDYNYAPTGPRATRIRLVTPAVAQPLGSPDLLVGGGVVIGGAQDLGTVRPPPGTPSDTRADSWICTVDLHQGDTGKMEFTRRGVDIRGAMLITRGPQKHGISGTWKGDSIRFVRVLGQNSRQQFEGTVSRTSGGQVRMAGRFAHEFSGVWSADCKPQLEHEGPPMPGAGGERFNVVLTGYGGNKIPVIKAVRGLTGLGLREAKDAVESPPYTVKSGVSADEARRIAAELEEAGGSARIELVP
jgi:ribosomal protein L7/L12